MLPALGPPSHAIPRESARHVPARHFRTAVRLLLALSLGATFVCLFRFPPGDVPGAIPIPVLSAVLAVTNPCEVSSRVTDLPA
jgi:hypothetical protein